MIVDFRSLLAAALAALVLLAPQGAGGDEPAQESADKTAQAHAAAQANAEVERARALLAEQIDKSIQHKFAYADLVSTLLANNLLGIDVAVPDEALKAQLNLAERDGVTVTNVPDESLGAKSGLKVHDVIVQVDQHGVGTPADLEQMLIAAGGNPVKLKVLRAGKGIELAATPRKHEIATLKWADALSGQLAGHELVHAQRYRLGVTLSEADDTLRTQLGLAAGEGLVVTDVVPESAAAEAGIRTHDVLTMLDGKRLTSVDAVNAQIQEIKDKSVELRLLRGGKDVSLRVTPRQTQEAAFADQSVRVWDTASCKTCHRDPHAQDPHQMLGWKLGANNSVWTDGNHVRLHHYERAFKAQTAAGSAQSPSDGPQQQIEALKQQLSQMRQTIAALESVIGQPPAKKEETKPEEKD